MLVVRDSVLAAVRLTRVVDEPRRPAHVLSIHDVASLGREVIMVSNKFVQTVQIAGFVLSHFRLALVSFLIGDHLAPVRVNELALYEILVAVHAPATSFSLEDGQGNFSAFLDETAFAHLPTSAIRITLVDWMPFLAIVSL